MGGKRRAQPSGNAQGKAAASGDREAAQGEASRKRQMRGLSVHDGAGSAGNGSSGQEESGSPVAMCLVMRMDPSTLVGRKAALEAALRKVVTEFGGRECRVAWTRVGPTEDTLQRVLPLVLERVEAESAVNMFKTCKAWWRELEARGFSNRTVQLCSALAEGGDAERLRQNALRRLDPRNPVCVDGGAFLEKIKEFNVILPGLKGLRGSLQEWLQAASQEPDASFVSREAASAAQCLGLLLVHWVEKPQGRYPGGKGWVGHSSAPVSMAFSWDGKRVVSGSLDKLVKIWNAETGAEVCTLTGHSGGVLSVDFSPSGKRVVSGSKDNLVKIWNAETGAEVFTFGGHSDKVIWVSFSTDGKRVVSASWDNLAKIWNPETGAEVCTLAGHSRHVCSVAFSADGKRVVSGSLDKLVKIWSAETGTEVCTLAGHFRAVFSVAFSPDNKSVVSGSLDNLVKIWDTETGAEVWTSRTHDLEDGCFCTMEEDEDGEDVFVRHPKCTMVGHSEVVTRVEFSADGAQVVSGSDDDSVRVWDVASGRQISELEGFNFALVEGLSDARHPGLDAFGERHPGLDAFEHKRHLYVITAEFNTLRIYKVAKEEEQHAEDGAAAPVALGAMAPRPVALGAMAPRVGAMAPVAFFKAPRRITSVRSHGGAVCVGCVAGTVCILSAPFLTA